MIGTFITTILLFFIFIINVKYSRDILCPVSVISLLYFVVFFFFIIFAFATKSTYWLDFKALYFPIGVIVFSFGFYLIKFILHNKYVACNGINNNCFSLTLIFKAVILISFVVTLIYVVHFTVSQWEYINFSLKRFVNANKINHYKPLFLFMYHQTFSLVLYYIASYLIFFNKYDKKDIIFYFIIIASAILHLIMIGNRTHLFKMIIPTLIMFLYSKKDNEKFYRFLIISIFVIVFLTAFLTKLINQPLSISFVRLYLDSGIAAFHNYLKDPKIIYYGKYTFRFVFAVLSKIGLYDGIVPWIQTSYPVIPEADWTVGNVYTFYHGYAQDFGLLYALLMQFLVSIIHTYLYFNSKMKNDCFWKIIFSVSYFPLVMQFFTDNYFVLTSFWIQVVLILVVFCKSNLFIVLKGK